MANLRRQLFLASTVAAVVGQLIVKSSPTAGMLLLAVALLLIVVDGWLTPRPLKSYGIFTAVIGLIGLYYWREPRGWFFILFAVIPVFTSLRYKGSAPALDSDLAFVRPDRESMPEPDAAVAAASEAAQPLWDAVPTAPPAVPVERWIRTDVEEPPNYFLALLWASGAAVVSAVAWFALTRATNWTFGLVAVGVGHAVGWCAVRGAGNRTSRALQIMAAVLGGLAILAGYYLIVRWHLLSAVAKRGIVDVSEARVFLAVMKLYFQHPVEIISPLGHLFIAFGVYDAWRVAARPVRG